MFGLYSVRKVLGQQADGAGGVLAGDGHLIAVSAALGDREVGQNVTADFGGGRREAGRHRRAFNAIGVAGAAVLQLVADFGEVLAVFGGGEADVAVGVAVVIIVGDGAAVGLANDEDGVDCGAEATAVDVDVEDLTLLRRELEEVDVAGLIELAVPRAGSGGRDRFFHAVVRFLFEDVVER